MENYIYKCTAATIWIDLSVVYTDCTEYSRCRTELLIVQYKCNSKCTETTVKYVLLNQ